MKYTYFENEQKIIFEKLDNGLEVYIVPNKYKKNYHIEIICKYGSLVEKFKLIDKDKYITIPSGSAHYLEHKLFDMENTDALKVFGEKGIYSNASTNYFLTRYYIDGNNNLKKNFDYLLKVIYTPYFTEDTVNKERDIIKEEIKMYKDEPMWNLYSELKNSLFFNVFKDDIAGTCESIEKISSNTLYNIYNTFYQPSNMFIVATGNVSAKQILDVINNNKEINNRITNKEIIYKEKKENKKVVNEYSNIYGNIIVPKLAYYFKFDMNDYKFIDNMSFRYYMKMIFLFLFSDGSDFSDIVMEKKIVNFYSIDTICYKNIYAIGIDAESEYADLFKEEVDNVLKNISITEEDFLREKKIWTSVLIRNIDNIGSLADNIIYNILNNKSYKDEKELLDKLNYQDLIKLIKKLDFSNHSFVLMLPKKN